jgi:hypothetical protein
MPPTSVSNTPHYRAELSTQKNRQSGVSQHELLYRLNMNKGAFVYYACPMLFDKTDLYEVEVDLNLTRIIEQTWPFAVCPTNHGRYSPQGQYDNKNCFLERTKRN